MKHLPCIPNEIVSEVERNLFYAMENKFYGPNLDEAKVLGAVDKLAGAYLESQKELDRYKGVVTLASDEEFWTAVKQLRVELGLDKSGEEQQTTGASNEAQG